MYKETNLKNPIIRKFGTNPPVSALYYAANLGKIDVFKTISDNLRNLQPKLTSGIYKGATPLHYAAQEGHIDIVTYITDCLQDINPAADDGKTPMHWAAEQGQNEIINFFIERLSDKNPPINSTNATLTKLRQESFEKTRPNRISAFYQMTPLHSAAQRGHLEVVKAITNVLADKDPKDPHGYTPLHAAASFGHLSIVEYLLKFEKDVNIQTDSYWKNRTPLHWAALNDHLDIVLFLISEGADPQLKTSDNKTAFDIAVENKNGEMYRALLKFSNGQKRL